MPSKPPQSNEVLWTPGARRAYGETLRHIAEQDRAALVQFESRVQHALEILALQPRLGTPISIRTDGRRFAIPKTGHTVEYLLASGTVIVVRWYRQRRQRA